jgi:hypothetical protein
MAKDIRFVECLQKKSLRLSVIFLVRKSILLLYSMPDHHMKKCYLCCHILSQAYPPTTDNKRRYEVLAEAILK